MRSKFISAFVGIGTSWNCENDGCSGLDEDSVFVGAGVTPKLLPQAVKQRSIIIARLGEPNFLKFIIIIPKKAQIMLNLGS